MQDEFLDIVEDASAFLDSTQYAGEVVFEASARIVHQVRLESFLPSVRIMSLASLATSEPACPMAIPTSDRLSEGESLTPSPV